MGEKRDNIYFYLWEELNTIYIGRTTNPKSRHYTHKHRESEKTYQFSNEHHVEHPKMVIIENKLTIEEGIEREKYWIKYYRENSSYNVLNKSCGGQKGRQNTKLTEEEKKKRQKEYYQKNKEKILAHSKEYRKTHIEKIRERDRKWHENHYKKKDKKTKTKEEILAYRKEYRKKYRQEHKEEINKKRRAEYQKNKGKRKEYFKKYYQEHKLKNIK